MNIEELNKHLKTSTIPEEAFGKNLDHNYRCMVKICHPDVCASPLATPTFELLQHWKEEADKKVKAGTYGDKKPVIPEYQSTTIKTKNAELELIGLLGEGLVASVHKAKDLYGRQHFIKVARDPKDNDLLDREFRHLKKLHTSDPDVDKEMFYVKQRRYIPKPEQEFSIAGMNGIKRRVNHFSIPPGQAYTLEELRKLDKFKDGIPRGHMYWIYRRLLMTLFMAHQRGICHGGVTPNHILVYPKEHGLVLLDWTSSCVLNEEHVPLFDKSRSQFYPPEVLQKKKATQSLDLYMATMSMRTVCERNLAPAVQVLLNKCLLEDPSKRPNNLLDFDEEFEAMIVKADGPRKYMEMIV